MAESMEVTPSLSETLDSHTIYSRVRELEDKHASLDASGGPSSSADSEKVVNDCVLDLESNIQKVLSEWSDAGSFLRIEDLDAYIERLKEEIIEAESINISNEIETLKRTYVEDSNQLMTDLEALKCSLDHIVSEDPKDTDSGAHDPSINGIDQSNMTLLHQDSEFEMLELESQIEKTEKDLKSLQDLDYQLGSFGVVEQIEDAFAGLNVIDVDNNFIRLSLRTYIPPMEELGLLQEKEEITESSELNHELLLEVSEGIMELKNVEIFPSDVYISDLLEASKSLSNTSLQWFIKKVQDRIVLCALRRFIVKSMNNSGHTVEYLDREDTVVCHMVEGFDAYIKVSQGWPLSKSPLKLISLKSSAHKSKGISSGFICKVEEMANSLDTQICRHLSSFMDAIEQILVEQMGQSLVV